MQAVMGMLPGIQAAQEGESYSVFVGDLDAGVDDYVLQEVFRQFYPTVRSAKVITDPATGRSKGYGFVRFASEPERDRALEMQGFNLGGRPIRVSLATARRAAAPNGPGSPYGARPAPLHPAEMDPTNTTLFIGGLSAGVAEDQLRAIFGRFGEIVYTKIPAGKGCGFVQFVERPAAEMAMAALNGQVIGTNAIRINWGRSTSRAPPPRDGGGGAAGAGAGAGAGYGAFGAGGPGALAAAAAAAFPGAGLPASAGYGGFGGAGIPASAGFANGFGLSAPMATPGLGLLSTAAAHGQGLPGLASGLGFGLGGAPGGGLFGGAGGGLYAPFDPAAAAGVDKLNAAYMARQQQLLGGANFLLPRS
ncbi:MAG: hypothetical protein J3K34DRAFT_516890 [Monoraphidium minutum]|nr:MAG: hypothetical protein J3K34DRAFT_516890 [Monoraphidium minutum]